MSLKSRLAADETLVTAWSGVPDALTVEILAKQGFDAITLDMQHGGHHEDSVLRGLMPVLAANKPALVRIPVGRFDMASRALDFGAEAVIAPMVNSVADARLFAAAMKYPPLGERSWGPTYAFPRHGKGDYAEWLRDTNQRTMAFAMVETRAALDALDGEERSAFVLHEVEELPLEDVAAVLRCSTRTVKRRLRAARGKLLAHKPEARS